MNYKHKKTIDNVKLIDWFSLGLAIFFAGVGVYAAIDSLSNMYSESG